MNNNQISTRNGYKPFDPWFDFFFGPDEYESRRNPKPLLMDADVIEKEDGYVLKINMPGVKKKDVSIEYESGYLNITATLNEEINEGKFLRRERNYVSSSRKFYVGDVDEEAIIASMEDGVLSLNIPKEKKVVSKHTITIK